MVALAWDGISSFSTSPIKIIVYIGLFQSIISFVFLVIFVILNLVNYQTLKIESIISLIVFLSGIQTLFIGIVGEYVGKIYFETKKRPRYIIKENLMYDGRK